MSPPMCHLSWHTQHVKGGLSSSLASSSTVSILPSTRIMVALFWILRCNMTLPNHSQHIISVLRWVRTAFLPPSSLPTTDLRLGSSSFGLSSARSSYLKASVPRLALEFETAPKEPLAVPLPSTPPANLTYVKRKTLSTKDCNKRDVLLWFSTLDEYTDRSQRRHHETLPLH